MNKICIVISFVLLHIYVVQNNNLWINELIKDNNPNILYASLQVSYGQDTLVGCVSSITNININRIPSDYLYICNIPYII